MAARVFIIFIAFIFTTCGLAQAQDEKTILDELDAKKLCKSDVKEDPKIYPSITNKTIISQAIKGNDLQIDYSELSELTLHDAILYTLVPCLAENEGKMHKSLDERMEHCWQQRWSKTHKSDAERFGKNTGALAARRNLLALFQYASTGGHPKYYVVKREWPTKNFTGSKEHPKVYSDLLYGEDKKNEAADTPIRFDAAYRPYQSQMLDDIAIMTFFSSDASVMSVYCRNLEFTIGGADKGTNNAGEETTKEETKMSRSFDQLPKNQTPKITGTVRTDVVNDYDIVWAAARWIGKENKISESCEYRALSAIEDSSTPSTGGKAAECSSLASTFTKTQGDIPRVAGLNQTSPLLTLGNKWSNKKRTHQLKVVSAPDQFGLGSDAQGGTAGTTIPISTSGSELTNAGDAQWTVDMAAGWSLSTNRTRNSIVKHRALNELADKTKTITTTFTPYVAIDLNATELEFLGTDADNMPAIFKKNIDYAELSAGFRWDVQESVRTNLLNGSSISDPIELAKEGRSVPGWRWAVTGEGITDNHNLVSASRAGFEFSPPHKWLEGLGPLGTLYGTTPFPIDAYGKKRLDADRKWNWWNNAWAGIYVNWDGQIAFDYLNYSRAPRDFTPGGEVADFVPLPVQMESNEFLEGGLYGTDLSLTLSKHDFLSIGKDDLFASLKLKWINRNEFQGDQEASRWEAEFKLEDPQGKSNRFISFKYEDGELYRTSQEIKDQFTFNLGYRY